MTMRWTAAIFGLAVAGCAGSVNGAAESVPTGGAVAVLRTAAGAEVGRAVVSPDGGGVRVLVQGVNMPAGIHGVHVHTTGRCDAPDFTTAGGHWNPTAMQHGTRNPAGPHAGDMPNLTVGEDGRGSVAITLPSGSMAGLMDADGSAFVVHAAADDLTTDPSGNSGARIACGVFVAA